MHLRYRVFISPNTSDNPSLFPFKVIYGALFRNSKFDWCSAFVDVRNIEYGITWVIFNPGVDK